MTGTYATLTEVHTILLLPTADTTIDVEINAQMLTANSWLENELSFYQVSVPIASNAPGFQTLQDAASWYTAFLIRQSREFEGQDTNQKKARAFEFLNMYVRGQVAQLASSGGGRPKEL